MILSLRYFLTPSFTFILLHPSVFIFVLILPYRYSLFCLVSIVRLLLFISFFTISRILLKYDFFPDLVLIFSNFSPIPNYFLLRFLLIPLKCFPSAFPPCSVLFQIRLIYFLQQRSPRFCHFSYQILFSHSTSAPHTRFHFLFSSQ
jgi:hypothetical protein